MAMTRQEMEALKIGDGIIVRYGSHGQQYAVVERKAGTKDSIVVRKFSANRQRWTRYGCNVSSGEIIRRAIPTEKMAVAAGLVIPVAVLP
jgi:sortase (surface protein transpeptidase)